MKCEEFIAFLADYLDELLPRETIARFELHLAGCRSCTAYLATYRETILMARNAANAARLDVRDAPEELIAAILASVR
ncbi:MAG: anti-sigma factor family protein [Thermoanaerobaculia bacterium]